MGRQKKKKMERSQKKEDAKQTTTCHKCGEEEVPQGPPSFYVPLSEAEIDAAKKFNIGITPVPEVISREFIAQLVVRLGSIKETRKSLGLTYAELSSSYHPTYPVCEMISVIFPELGTGRLPAWKAPFSVVLDIRKDVTTRTCRKLAIMDLIPNKNVKVTFGETKVPITTIGDDVTCEDCDRITIKEWKSRAPTQSTPYVDHLPKTVRKEMKRSIESVIEKKEAEDDDVIFVCENVRPPSFNYKTGRVIGEPNKSRNRTKIITRPDNCK